MYFITWFNRNLTVSESKKSTIKRLSAYVLPEIWVFTSKVYTLESVLKQASGGDLSDTGERPETAF